jgi:hypothetical protein
MEAAAAEAAAPPPPTAAPLPYFPFGLSRLFFALSPGLLLL